MTYTIKVELTEDEVRELISLIARHAVKSNLADKLFKGLHRDRLDQEQKIRRYRKGVYRVWSVWHERTQTEERYATKVLAQDYIQRRGGVLFETDFNDRAEAQAYLNEARGDIWW